MRLYLSSYRIPTPEDFFELVAKKPKDVSIGIIPNAKDYYSKRVKRIKTQQVVNYFMEMGIKNIQVIDLGKYDASNNSLKKNLEEFDIIWVMGGNTFCLRHAMKISGFDEVIHSVLKKSVIYAGESAGALVAGNTLKGVEFADPPEFAEEIIWDGLSLTNHFVLPHVNSIGFEDVIEKVKALHIEDSTLIELTDDEAYIITDNSEHKTGA